MGREGDEAQGSWRAALADKIGWPAFIAIAAAYTFSLLSTITSPRIVYVTTYAFAPVLLVLAIQYLFVRSRDYRVRAWLTIGGLAIVGVSGASAVGLMGGPVGAMFLSLLFTALLFDRRAMFGMLAAIACGVTVIAWAMSTGVLPPPLVADVSFANPTTWIRTGANVLVLLGLGAVAAAQVVRALEDALARVRREAAERERAQEERTRALELALEAQKVEVVGRLAAGLAHDLNNSLFVIDASNQLLLRRKMTDAERLDAHAAIADAVKQSSSMARQLLTFARKHVVSAEALSTAEVIDELQRGLTKLFPSDMTVTIECAEAATVRTDRVHLQQAIFNLAINARDAMSAGGEVSVRASVVTLTEPRPALSGDIPLGRFAAFEVRDTGSGMDVATKQRAFEPLFTTKPEGKGTGLGLASVRSTIEHGGGHVTLWSEAGKGTCITLYLPALEQGSDAVVPISHTAPAHDLHGVTVLLAEDSREVRGVIAEALTHHGCTVLQARDGNTALEQIEKAQTPIDVLCTDAVMPGAPAREVIARLQAKFPSSDVLVISGYVTDELTRRGIEQGRYRMLAKPFETQKLLDTIVELRDKRRTIARERAG